uniref:Uncharacterized protein n=1 Tax=Parascaris univalens TaxID=6257 RepID=A0A915AGY9_PARUN
MIHRAHIMKFSLCHARRYVEVKQPQSYKRYRQRQISRKFQIEHKRCSKAAIIIQSCVRGYLARRRYNEMRKRKLEKP